MEYQKPLERFLTSMTLARFICVAALLAPALAAPSLAQFRGSADVATARSLVALDRLYAGSRVQAVVVLSIDEGWHVNAHKPGLDYLIATSLELTPSDGLRSSEVRYPKPKIKEFEFAGEALPVYEGDVALRFEVQADSGLPPGTRSIEGTLTVQACSDRVCLAPARLPISLQLEVADFSQPVQPLHPEWFEAEAVAGENSPARRVAGNSAGATIANLLEQRGWWLTFGLIFLWGLGLNLTPCVYPLIPITIAYFGAQAQERSLPTSWLAALYVAGIALTYSLLGVAAALTGNILGASLQNPWILAGIAAILVALALSFFGLYEVRLPSFVTSRLGSRRGATGALFMGLTMGLVAAPCIAPVVIPLLAYVGATGDPWQGLWMFMTLSLGMGLPYVFLAMGAGAIQRLPRAGEWMVGVKRLFGLALIVMAVYFLGPLLPKGIEPWSLPGVLLLTALYLLIFERTAEQIPIFRVARLAASALALAGALWIGWPAPPGVDWKSYSDDAVAAARQAGRPVIIDFYADWCLPCKELDRFTFRDPRVVEAAEDFITLKANLTQFTSPPVEALRLEYDIAGVPTVLFLDSEGREPAHLRVIGYLSGKRFHERMREVLDGGARAAVEDEDQEPPEGTEAAGVSTLRRASSSPEGKRLR